MASQKSHLTLQGPLNGVGYYKRQGKFFARTMPFYNQTNAQRSAKEQSATLIRRKENNSEFKGAVEAAKQIKTALRIMPVGLISRPNLQAQLTALALSLKYSDTTHARGQRSILLSTGTAIFKDYLLSKGSVTSLLPSLPTATRSGATVTFATPIMPQGSIYAPEGATHFRFVFGVVTASDMKFDATENAYVPVAPNAYARGAMALGSWNGVNAEVAAISQAVQSPTAALDSAAIFAVVGIQFAQQVGESYYPLQEQISAYIADGWDGGNE